MAKKRGANHRLLLGKGCVCVHVGTRVWGVHEYAHLYRENDFLVLACVHTYSMCDSEATLGVFMPACAFVCFWQHAVCMIVACVNPTFPRVNGS